MRQLTPRRQYLGVSLEEDAQCRYFVAGSVLVFLLAGLVERGYVTRVWKRTSGLGRGRVYRRN